MATVRENPTFSDQDPAELAALTKGADTVELKLTVPVSERAGRSLDPRPDLCAQAEVRP